ncbi:hypothetical protein AB0M43_22585 [Longispora sp. NPDC051575]|uniref:hypothetical protein n=1 Tax=Longispora sp. NPDC051575 TaxID=3154943 RepID=UPI003440C1A4
MAVRWETVFVENYGRLVRAAYVVDAGQDSRQRRWARAHRLVRRALPLRSGRQVAADPDAGYRTLLTRVLTRSLGRRFPWPGPFGRGAGVAPAGGPEHAAVDQALAAVEPQARVAYLLLLAEGMDRKSATGVLQAVGVPDSYAAVNKALKVRDALDADYGIDAERQSELLDEPAMNPAATEVRAPAPAMLRTARVGRGALGGAAGIVALVGVATLATGAWSGPEPQKVEPVRPVTDTEWRNNPNPVLAAWPSRGSERANTALTSRAVSAWRTGKKLVVGRGADGSPPAGVPQLLFAGKVDGKDVVLLADKSRIARYSDKGLELSPMPVLGTAGASALHLVGTRYLLAPWIQKAQVATLGGGWQDLAAADGITDPVRPVPGSCYTGPLLRLTTQDVAAPGPLTLADLGQISLAHITVGDPKAARYLDTQGSWERLGCQVTEWQGSAVVAVHAWEFATGPLPAKAGTGSWVCLRADLVGGANMVRAVLLGPGGTATTVAQGTRLCSARGGPVAATAWWKAPSGSWYLLAAGSPGVDRIEAAAGVLKGSSKTYLTLGPVPNQTPTMTVKARDAAGADVPVLGVIGG